MEVGEAAPRLCAGREHRPFRRSPSQKVTVIVTVTVT